MDTCLKLGRKRVILCNGRVRRSDFTRHTLRPFLIQDRTNKLSFAEKHCNRRCQIQKMHTRERQANGGGTLLQEQTDCLFSQAVKNPVKLKALHDVEPLENEEVAADGHELLEEALPTLARVGGPREVGLVIVPCGDEARAIEFVGPLSRLADRAPNQTQSAPAGNQRLTSLGSRQFLTRCFQLQSYCKEEANKGGQGRRYEGSGLYLRLSFAPQTADIVHLVIDVSFDLQSLAAQWNELRCSWPCYH